MENRQTNPEAREAALLRLEGRLVRHEDQELELLIRELLDRSCRRFILDFNLVEFIDSSGIGLIMKLASLIEKTGGALLLCNPQDNVRKVFSMLGLESRFKIYNDLGETLLVCGRLLNLEIISVKF